MGKFKKQTFGKRGKPYDRSERNSADKQSSDQQKRNFTVKETLREDQVGITEYTTKSAGFTGVIKSRFSDFHVNEIDQNGVVVELTDLTVPKWQSEAIDEQVVADLQAELKHVLTDEIWQRLDKLSTQEHSSEAIKIDVSTLDKDMRTQVHKLLQEKYGDTFIRDVQSEPKNAANNEPNAKRFIDVTLRKGKTGKLQRYEGWRFPEDYVHFTAHKENMDTSDIVTTIASRVKCHPSKINFAGTKDKRGKTSQRLCIKKRTPEEIAKAVARIPNIQLGNFEFSKDVLKLGDLKGNRFRIALRHINGDVSDIEAALQEVRQHGFINYFGLQRFGNCVTVPTHEVGVALLKSKYKLACELILKPRENDHWLSRMRATWWETRDAQKALKMMGYRDCIEKKLLQGLANCNANDYMTPLQTLPRNMLMLYVHAYQSLIFNRIASRRIKEFGLKPMLGDLVYCNKAEVDDIDFDLGIGQETNDTEAGEASDAESAPQTTSQFKRKVRPLTECEIERGDFSIYDVVLPLPGYDITYPNNEVAKWYEEILSESDLTSETLHSKLKVLSLGGAYRKMVIQTSDLTWCFRRYAKPEDTLILSDIERLRNVELAPEPAADEPHLLALILELSLPAAVYATMFLREVLKNDTSASSQIQLEAKQLKSDEI